MEQLIRRHLNRMQTVNLDFLRGLMNRINWNDRLILIKGQRGVGKTTLMLQRILKVFGSTDTSTVLYVSLDNIYFASHGLLDFIEQFHKMGGKYLFIDEVHKYKNWSREIKNAYDEFTDLKMVLSGSSLVNMIEGEADLSRRCISYEMQGLSFREYIEMFHRQHFDVANLDDILRHGNDICTEINAKVRPIALFNQYLRLGYYPFLIEGKDSYYTRIENGRYPVVAMEFLGDKVEGKDIIVVDDMISSGDSAREVARELKKRKANRVFICATFGMFTNGLEQFDRYYENGLIDRILTTNLVYQSPELLSRKYYVNVDMSKYIALIIDNLNHDSSISEFLEPSERVQRAMARHEEERKAREEEKAKKAAEEAAKKAAEEK